MAVLVQETIVTPTRSGSIVQLYISDKPRGDESSTTRLVLTAKVVLPDQPLLAEVQRLALVSIREDLSGLLQSLQAEIDKAR